MKRVMIILFLISFGKPCYCQWTSVDTIDLAYGFGNEAKVTIKYLNEDEVFWYSEYDYITPTYPAYYVVSRTANSFANKQVFFPVMEVHTKIQITFMMLISYLMIPYFFIVIVRYLLPYIGDLSNHLTEEIHGRSMYIIARKICIL